jgi:hypothetical protein
MNYIYAKILDYCDINTLAICYKIPELRKSASNTLKEKLLKQFLISKQTCNNIVNNNNNNRYSIAIGSHATATSTNSITIGSAAYSPTWKYDL